jgi:hypothetical protein
MINDWEKETVVSAMSVVFAFDIINQLAWAAFLGIKYRKYIFPTFKPACTAAESPKNRTKVA